MSIPMKVFLICLIVAVVSFFSCMVGLENCTDEDEERFQKDKVYPNKVLIPGTVLLFACVIGIVSLIVWIS